MAIADCYEVGTVLGECDAFDFYGGPAGGDSKLCSGVPDVDDHVKHVANRDEEVGGSRCGKGDAVDGVFVAAEFGELNFVSHVPYADFWLLATLKKIINLIQVT